MPTSNDFTRFDFDSKSNDGSYKSQNGENNAGEYGQVNPSLTSDQEPEPASGIQRWVNYPNVYQYGYDANNRQCSSDKADTPEAIASETRESMSNFADLQAHLNNSLDVIGGRVSHDRTKPWEPPHGE